MERKERGTWTKDGVWWFESEGWREVKPKKWVRYATQELKNGEEYWRYLSVWFGGDTTPIIFEVPECFRWKSVEIEKLED